MSTPKKQRWQGVIALSLALLVSVTALTGCTGNKKSQNTPKKPTTTQNETQNNKDSKDTAKKDTKDATDSKDAAKKDTKDAAKKN